MDLSQFLDVTCDEGEAPLDNLTEEDIVLLDDLPARPAAANGKRVYANYYNSSPVALKGPPAKKARRSGPAGGGQRRRNGAGGGAVHSAGAQPDLAAELGRDVLSAHAVGILKSRHITVKKVNSAPAAPSPQRPAQPLRRPAGSITWKYKQLPENQYTADIRDEWLDHLAACYQVLFENRWIPVLWILQGFSRIRIQLWH